MARLTPSEIMVSSPNTETRADVADVQSSHNMSALEVPIDRPLIGVISRRHGKDVVRYFADDASAGAAVADTAVKRALAAIGSWSDLDWDEMEDALRRLRRESKPTPPIDLDL